MPVAARQARAKRPPPDPAKRALTPKEQRFVHGYTLHWNASRAVREAGYDSRAPHEYGYELLRKPHIHARIQVVRDEWEARQADLAVEAQQFLANQLRANPKAFFTDTGRLKDLKDIGDADASLLLGLEVDDQRHGGKLKKVKLASRAHAADALLRKNAEWRERGLRRFGPKDDPSPPPPTEPDSQFDLARRIAFAMRAAAEALEKGKK